MRGFTPAEAMVQPIIVVPNCSLGKAAQLAERLRPSLAIVPFPEVGVVTVSIGFAAFTPGLSLDGWVRLADAALCEAKFGGRNTVRIAD
jgi:GGDEF domain-containing protein